MIIKIMGIRLKMTALFIVICLSLKANDGTYLSRGSLIYPISETKISLEKEILSFTCIERVSQVNIYFEFNNPEKTERKILIGFQAPYPGGDLPYRSRFIPKTQISNFKILKDGEIIPFKLKAAKCEDCELKDTSEFVVDKGSYGIYVYLFEITFKPGLNIINHSYDFPASNRVTYDEFYNYILKTGSKWANGTITDFSLQIDMGKNSYFYVSDIFPKTAKWTIVGSGLVTNKYFNDYNKYSSRMVRILSGKLEITIKNFKPTQNLEFGKMRNNSFISYQLDNSRAPKNMLDAMISLTPNFRYSPEITFNKEDLRILRNYVYAQHGYTFKSKDLQNYFSQFEWYLPDPTLILDKILLTDNEKKFIDEIIEKER